MGGRERAHPFLMKKIDIKKQNENKPEQRKKSEHADETPSKKN
jgi:hypothetical protein